MKSIENGREVTRIEEVFYKMFDVAKHINDSGVLQIALSLVK
jgi:hypothetical protein